jgi:hypothetical protein
MGLDSWLNEDANAMTLEKDILYVAQNLFGFSTTIHEAVFTGVPNNGW